MPDRRCAVCHFHAHHEHHVVYRQHVVKHGGDPDDPRNLMPLCFDCHGAHHNRSRVIQRSQLPDAAVAFAVELLGDYAPDYLGRYYRGPSLISVEDRHTVTVDGAAGAEEFNRRGPLFPAWPERERPERGDAA